MVTVAQIRQKLQDKIFTPYGKSVTLQHDNTHTYNTRGDITAYNWTSSTISLVPYDFTTQALNFEDFSSFLTGDFFAAVPYSVTISAQDRIVMDGTTYEVKEKLDHLLPTNAVIIIRLTKIVS